MSIHFGFFCSLSHSLLVNEKVYSLQWITNLMKNIRFGPVLESTNRTPAPSPPPRPWFGINSGKFREARKWSKGPPCEEIFWKKNFLTPPDPPKKIFFKNFFFAFFHVLGHYRAFRPKKNFWKFFSVKSGFGLRKILKKSKIWKIWFLRFWIPLSGLG